MIDAIGGGLIGCGAILLVVTLVLPTVTTGNLSEFERTNRNTQVAIALSVLATATGALMVLVNGQWAWAIVGLGGGGLVYYLVQVAITYRAWRALARQVELERSRIDGRITVETASRIGLLPSAASAPWAAPHSLAVEGSGDQAGALTRERSRLRWAFRHPRGGLSGRTAEPI